MDTGNENSISAIEQNDPDNLTNKNTRRIIISIVVTAIVLLIALFIAKTMQISKIRKNAAAERQELQDKSLMQLRKSDELHLRSIAKPLVWVIRSEMLKNNMSQLNLYANEMVKEKNFQKIVVANDKGVVLVSTNKKDEGKAFVSPGKVDYLAGDATIVENIDDSLMIMSSPVMGFNNRLGTLIITYTVQYQKLN